MEKCYSEVELNQENLTYNIALEQELWKEEVKDTTLKAYLFFYYYLYGWFQSML